MRFFKRLEQSCRQGIINSTVHKKKQFKSDHDVDTLSHVMKENTKNILSAKLLYTENNYYTHRNHNETIKLSFF